MKSKSETQGLLKQFIAFSHIQFHYPIKHVRSNNGLEFTFLKSYFADLGIIFQNSNPHTPQQNGVVERKHRHLLNVTRALLYHSYLPNSLWGKNILTAAYSINRVPSFILHN